MGPRPPLKSATVIWFEGGKRQGVIEKILRLPLDQRQPFSKSTRVALRRGSGRHQGPDPTDALAWCLGVSRTLCSTEDRL